MKIGELAIKSALGIDTLRYYERIGLLPRTLRDASNQRVYDPSILVWVEFLSRLKATGMPLRDMVIYAQMRGQGLHTSAQRCDILNDHRTLVRAKLAELTDNLAMLDKKIIDYQTYLETKNDKSDQSNPL